MNETYTPPISPYGFIFISAHFIWAFSLMFLYSGRGYWQEFIESILWGHHKLKIMVDIQPRALDISQGRAVGFIHYTLGGILGKVGIFFLLKLKKENLKEVIRFILEGAFSELEVAKLGFISVFGANSVFAG